MWFYIAQYPVRWTAQRALHFPPLADLFIPTPTWLLLEALTSRAAIAQRLFTHMSTTEDIFVQVDNGVHPCVGSFTSHGIETRSDLHPIGHQQLSASPLKNTGKVG